MQRMALRCLPGINGQTFARCRSPVSHCISSSRQWQWQGRWMSQNTSSRSTSAKGVNGPTACHGIENKSGTAHDDHSLPLSLLPPTDLSSLETRFQRGETVIVQGFLGKRRDKSSNLTFCNLDTNGEVDLQIVALIKDRDDPTDPSRQVLSQFKEIPAYSPVAVAGILERRPQRTGALNNGGKGGSDSNAAWDLKLTRVEPLNEFSRDIIVSKDAVWSPSQRHLQLRFDSLLRNRLQLRSKANFSARNHLMGRKFHEYETPVLFKSTPEGAREFLVPTRQPGLAYALPQSPQQCKQMLMASGIRRYFQFARCFRDEDSRADRQPEFTQLDLEMAFATGEDVIMLVENVIFAIFRAFRRSNMGREVDGVLYTSHEELVARYASKACQVTEKEQVQSVWPMKENSGRITRMTYDTAMAQFGSDKPDLRIPSQIIQISRLLSDDFKKMITHLEDPIVEATQFKLNGTPSQNLVFIREIMEGLSQTTLKLGPDSTPGIFVFDETKPINGLAAIGHEAGQQISELQTESWPQLEHGDLLVVHARKRTAFKGEGWTELGRLRKLIYDAAIKQELMDRDLGFRFCWIHDFPLFTNDIEPGEGQGGNTGVKATHHPFTAPKREFCSEDRLAIQNGSPWLVKGDHYDLVLNGTEVGGGSRRIHKRSTQEYVMRTVLGMQERGIKQFEHLLEALDAGCPPHAGFAIGWDRFITLLCGVDSIRDVIAFPKNQKGEDLLVKSPSQLTASQMNEYHLAPKGWATSSSKLW